MRFIFLTLLMAIYLTAVGQNISAEITYFKNKDIITYSDLEYTPFVTEFVLDIGNMMYVAKKQDEHYKTWLLEGFSTDTKVQFSRSEGRCQWKFFFESDSLLVRFYDTNDPRMLELEWQKKTYWMASHEPDCNSIFGLYKKKLDSEYDYESDDALILGSARNECDDAKWTFKAKKKVKLPQEVIVAFCFTAVVAMDVRYIGHNDW